MKIVCHLNENPPLLMASSLVGTEWLMLHTAVHLQSFQVVEIYHIIWTLTEFNPFYVWITDDFFHHGVIRWC